MKLSTIIRLYIEAHNLSLDEISIHTHIPSEKLLPDSTIDFNATELLVLCDYFHTSPETFFQIASLLKGNY